MARIDSQTLFLTTSPRTAEKMIPEIELLCRKFSGREWNTETQTEFMNELAEENFYNGKGLKDPAFSARDRINRAPKSLGFVDISDKISLTPAGNALLTSRRTNEVFLRQMLKFQLPSPFHKPTAQAANFCIKPYLEILRLVRTLGTLKFDELHLFGMQLTDWHDFDLIVRKIEKFRADKLKNKGSYRKFKAEYSLKELSNIYQDNIAKGETKTRESSDNSKKNFLKTKSRNMRDYADACFRYLRATGLVNVSHVGKSLSIVPECIADVDYLLATVDREPMKITSEVEYTRYLGNATTPKLLTDDKERLIEKIRREFPTATFNEADKVEVLKDLLDDLMEQRKADIIAKQVADIKDYKLYDDIQSTFMQIKSDELYDAPLMLEWNTWRAMTMLDGGEIKANLNFDDFGNPLSTAAANMADIVCDYGDYMLTVEVTMSSGQKQYEMESEPVSRHLGKMKKATGKPCYTLFVAPTINEACIAHFYGLHSLNISYYGGKSVIVPLPIEVFQKMLEDSFKASYTPNPKQVQRFFEFSKELVNNCADEKDWYEKITAEAASWLH